MIAGAIAAAGPQLEGDFMRSALSRISSVGRRLRRRTDDRTNDRTNDRTIDRTIHRTGRTARDTSSLLRDTRGAVVMIVALGMLPLLGATGLAVDAALGYVLKSRLSKSLDTAGLAAGRVALNDDAQDVALAFFEANFSSGAGAATITEFTFELDPTRQFVTLEAVAETPTMFMRIFGREIMTVSARTVIERETTGLELALVLDNTGSMWACGSCTTISGSPFEAMQNAAFDLIDIVFGEETEVENLWVSLVPYVATVNVGSGRSGWLNPTDSVFSNPSLFDPVGWKGCVMARAHPHDGDDTPPTTHPFTSYLYPQTSTDNNWPPINDTYLVTNSTARGPNLACGSPITPLTASRATIEAGIAEMKPWRRGGTAGNLGLAWGWRTISPQWRGLWGGETPATHPLDYDEPLMEKIAVILTDGNNEFFNLPNGEGGDPSTPSDFTAYGRVNAPGPVGLAAATTGAGVAILNTRMAGTCTAMKAQGIRIYTITFGSAPNAAAQTLFRNCATSPAMYYHAPNNSQLSDVFRAIGGQLANLRIVE
jgi:Flp pilus assembly protein TadG